MYRPALYKDESFYSYLGRISRHLLLSIGLVKRSFFGSNDFRVSLLLTTRLGKMVNRGVLNKSEADEILKNNTLVEYFKAFLNKSRRIDFDLKIWQNDNSLWTFENQFGFDEGKDYRIPKYCPLCLKEQLDIYGEPYLNRFHQIPNILICVEHGCNLVSCKADLDTSAKYIFYRPSLQTCPLVLPEMNTSKLVLDIAKSCISIALGEYKLDTDYKKRAELLGYLKGSRIDQVRLRNDFENFYRSYASSYSPYTENMLEVGKVKDPHRHIMLDHFLRKKLGTMQLKELTVVKKKFWDRSYFGNEPWKCLVQDCERNVKADFTYRSGDRKTVGYFKCECGCVYSKSFIINEVGIFRTIVRKIHNQVKTLKPVLKATSKATLKLKRKQWIALKMNDEKSFEQLKRMQYVQQWLSTYDKKWFLENKQVVQARVKKKFLAKEEKRLKNELILIGNVVKDFKLSASRVTRKGILRILGWNVNKKYDAKVENLLKENCEEVEDFLLRKISIKYNQMIGQRKHITIFSLTRAITRKPSIRVKNEVVNFLLGKNN
jgi:TniQ/Tn7-like transposition protein D